MTKGFVVGWGVDFADLVCARWWLMILVIIGLVVLVWLST